MKRIKFIQFSLKLALLVVLLQFPFTSVHSEDIDIYAGLDTQICLGSTESFKFIFMVDNSGSVSDFEYDQMQRSVNRAISEVLYNSGLPNVEIAIVQYGGRRFTDSNDVVIRNHRYNVFTGGSGSGGGYVGANEDGVSIPVWDRSTLGLQSDHLPMTLAKMRVNGEWAPGGRLYVGDATNVQMVIFTDAWRNQYLNDPNFCCSNLVAFTNPNPGNRFYTGNDPFFTDVDYPEITPAGGFGEYNQLKRGDIVQNDNGDRIRVGITIVNVPDVGGQAAAEAASAAIASKGGSWFGDVELATADPQGGGTTPRRYATTTFAQSTDALLELLRETIGEERAVTFTRSSPAVTVDAFTRLRTRDELFFSLFEPTRGPRWDGNVKGYLFRTDGAGNEGLIDYAVPPKDPTDPDTLSLIPTALSRWSPGQSFPECAELNRCTPTADGGEVSVGSFRTQLTSNRKVYTDQAALELGSNTDCFQVNTAAGVFEIQPDSKIQRGLLGLPCTNVTEQEYADQTDAIFEVTGGDSLNLGTGTNNLIYRATATSREFTERAQTDFISTVGTDGRRLDINKPYALEFRVNGTALQFITIGFETSSPGRNSRAWTTCTAEFGLYLTGLDDRRVYLLPRQPLASQEFDNCTVHHFSQSGLGNPPSTIGSAIVSYNDGNLFRIEIDGSKYRVLQNGQLFDEGDSATGPYGPVAGQDYILEVAAWQDITLKEELSLTDFTWHQEDIGIEEETGQLELENIVRWIAGQDVTDFDGDENVTEAHQFIGDGIHASPRVVTYSIDADGNPVDEILFYSTNVGLLHAIDTASGEAMWSYIPKDLLDNPIDYIRGDEDEPAHTYGLDGLSEVWIRDRDPTTFVPRSVYYYQGMRRGGREYIALDVTNATSANALVPPFSKLFTIKGGETPGFNRLGQTWSAPKRSIVNSCTGTTCVKRDVLVFSGGYDDVYDSPAVNPRNLTGVLGNHIYIVDAETGDLLWSAGSTDPSVAGDQFLRCTAQGETTGCYGRTDHAFVAAPSLLDLDADGAIDTLFAVDIVGRLWRFDFNASSSATGAAAGVRSIENSTGGTIADFNQGFASQTRYFYSEPNVALIESDTGNLRLNIAVGSGNLSSPLEDEKDDNAMYVVFDPFVTKAPELSVRYRYVTNGSIRSRIFARTPTNAGDNLPPIQLDGDPNDLDDFPYGFRIELNGTTEKIFNPALTRNNQLVFTSYTPRDPSNVETMCSFGSNTLYVADLITGEVVSEALVQEGIAPTAQLLVSDMPDSDNILIGLECPTCDKSGLSDMLKDKLKKSTRKGIADPRFWYEIGSDGQTRKGQ